MGIVENTAVLAASEGSFLIKPGVGLMIWTLVVFFVTFLLLKRIAFPAISKALDSRQKAIEDSIDTAERTRVEADKLLAEYRERLKEARSQADEIEQLAQFAGALEADRQLAIFFFSPYFSTAEKEQGLERMLDGADESFLNFLRLLIEKHRMPVLFRIRVEYQRLWDNENKVLPVEI